MRKLPVIVFDFDNCIALDPRTGEGSEEIKDRAWYAVFPEYNHGALKVILGSAQRAIAGGRGDRKDVASMVLTHFGFKGCVSEEAIARCERFDAVVQEGILALGISPEVKNALRSLSEKTHLYINTATPREPMVRTLNALGLSPYFKGVYGRPGTKVTNLGRIATMEDALFDRIVFVGDATGDYEAAKIVGCNFIGVRTMRNISWYNPQRFHTVRSVDEVEALFKRPK